MGGLHHSILVYHTNVKHKIKYKQKHRISNPFFIIDKMALIFFFRNQINLLPLPSPNIAKEAIVPLPPINKVTFLFPSLNTRSGLNKIAKRLFC